MFGEDLRWWQRILVALLCLTLMIVLVVLVLLIVVLIKAMAIPTSALDYGEIVEPWIDWEHMERAQRLADAIKLQTVSFDKQQSTQDMSSFLEFHKHLQNSFPLMHNADFVQRTVVNNYSLLYTITGSDNGDKLPYMLAAHMDVVPAHADAWEIPPFSGQIINDTYIYGRGTLDNKSGVLAALEALEYMLINGTRPKRSFFMAFGHDEELGGKNGAQEIAKILQYRGITSLDFILDEGYFVSHGVLLGAEDPVAMIGVSEKGMLTLELSVNGTRKHSSFPPRESAIGILASAVAKLEKNKLPSMLGQGVERFTFEYLAPHVHFGYRMIFSNLWLFSNLLSYAADKDPKLNAIIRTTTALTVIKGGDKSNVVPGSAHAIVNHRIHPSQTVADVIEFDRNVIDDPRVEITPRVSREAAPVTPFGENAPHYQLIAKTISQIFNRAAVVPSVLIANTDTKWYQSFTKHIFRFFPTLIRPADVARFHGDNERISVVDYNRAIQFYCTLIRNAELDV